MLRRVTTDSMLYAAAAIASRGSWVLLVPIYAEYLSPEQFGLMEYFAVLGLLVVLTVSLEIGQAVGRFVPEIRDKSDELTSICSTALWFAVSVHVLVATMVVVFREEISDFIFSTPNHGALLALSAVGHAAFALMNVIMAQLRAELRPKSYVKLSLFNTAILVTLTVGALVLLNSGLRGVLLAQLTANVAGVALGLYFTRQTVRPTFSMEKLRTLLWFSVPLVPSGIGVIVTQFADRFVIKDLMTLADVGIYGMGSRFSLVVLLAFFGLQYALTPMIYANLSDERTPGRVALLFRHAFALSMFLFLNVTLTSDWLIRLMAPDSYLAAATVLPILALAGFFRTSHIFAPGLGIAKKTILIAAINVAAAVINVTLNYALIPHLGIMGAAVATLISTASLFAAYVLFGQQHYRIEFGWFSTAAALTLTVTLIGIFQFLELGVVARVFYLMISNGVLIASLIGLKVIDLAVLGKLLSASGGVTRDR